VHIRESEGPLEVHGRGFRVQNGGCRFWGVGFRACDVLFGAGLGLGWFGAARWRNRVENQAFRVHVCSVWG